MARNHPYSRSTLAAVLLLGLEVARARRARRWTAAELAERAGITRVTLRKVESGDPSVAVGTVFEVATLVGIPLIGADPAALPDLIDRATDRLKLLPARVREPAGAVDDDF